MNAPHEAGERAPWGFRVFVVVAALYLIWRLVQLGVELVRWLV